MWAIEIRQVVPIGQCHPIVLLSVWIVLLCTSPLFSDYDLGEFELDEKQLKQTVYGQGFSIGLDENTIDKLMEIQELLKQSQWVKAFRLMDENRTLWHNKQVPRQDGFSFPVHEYLWRLVAHLPPDALEAFRLYYDSKASALLRKSRNEDPDKELQTLREIYNAHFFTKAGAQAANRYADALFQSGNFRLAGKIWTDILEQHPSGPIPELKLQCKRAIAYFRAGDFAANSDAILALSQRFTGQEVILGGKSITVDAFATQWKMPKDNVAKNTDVSAPLVRIPRENPKSIWSIEFKSQGGNPNVVPGVTLVQDTVIVNFGRKCAAFDVRSGKRAWSAGQPRKGNFLKLFNSIATRIQEQIVGGSFSQEERPGAAELLPVAHNDRVYALNYQEPKNPKLQSFALKDGTLHWETTTQKEKLKLVGNLVPLRLGVLACAYGTETTNELNLVWFQEDGSVGHQLRLGTVQPKSNPYRGNNLQPSPVLLKDANHVFVIPSDGVVIAIDRIERKTAWSFRYAPPRKDPSQMTWFGGYRDFQDYYRATVKLFDEKLYFKDAEGQTMYSIDPVNRKAVWKRPIVKDAELLNINQNSIILLEKNSDGTHDLMSYHRDSTQMQQVIRLPSRISLHNVFGRSSFVVSTDRGLFEIDNQDWEWHLPFRGGELNTGESDLFVHDDILLSVNREKMQAFSMSATKEEP